MLKFDIFKYIHRLWKFIVSSILRLPICLRVRCCVCEMHSVLFAFELIGYNNRIGDVNLIDDFERLVIIDMRSQCRLES